MNTMHKYLLIALLLASTTACNKWLDLQPQDGITKAEFWKTKEDVKAALYGIYSSLNDGGVEERLFLWGELRGDM
ncbi:RagB/SusD family nutrient uptake outer membrane protein, partial [Acinetobacter baumannii]